MQRPDFRWWMGIVEDRADPEKMGRYTPGTGIPIVNEDLLIKSKKNGDIFIVLPWHFKENFLNNPKYRGLTLVFPLPNIEIKRDV